MGSGVPPTDVYIYILDTVPPIHVLWNHVGTEAYHCKWRMAERLPRVQPDSVANRVKARQSLIECAVT